MCGAFATSFGDIFLRGVFSERDFWRPAWVASQREAECDFEVADIDFFGVRIFF